MKYFILLLLVSTTISCFAQANPEKAPTLDPTTSKILGGFISLDGVSSWSENGNSSNRHSINIGPYFSLNRTAKRDILLRTSLLFQSIGNGTPGAANTSVSLDTGLDWRHELSQFTRFKVFGSYGPRLGVNVQDGSLDDTTLGFTIAATGSVALAYELTHNFRLLTNVFNGIIQYRRFGSGSNTFNYNLRNSLLSPNFSVEYILRRKSGTDI